MKLWYDFLVVQTDVLEQTLIRWKLNKITKFCGLFLISVSLYFCCWLAATHACTLSLYKPGYSHSWLYLSRLTQPCLYFWLRLHTGNHREFTAFSALYEITLINSLKTAFLFKYHVVMNFYASWQLPSLFYLWLSVNLFFFQFC